MEANVVSYGALGGNVVADTAGFDAAFNAVMAGGGGRVIVPVPTGGIDYQISSLNWDPVCDFRFVGLGSPRITCVNALGSNAITIGNAGIFRQCRVTLDDLKIWGTGTNGNGLKAQNIANFTMREVSIFNHVIGFFANALYTMLSEDCDYSTCRSVGAYLIGASGNGSTFLHPKFVNCSTAGAIGLFEDGAAAGAHYGTTIINPTIEGNETGIAASGVNGFNILGGYAEVNSRLTVDVRANAPNKSVNIEGMLVFDKGIQVRGADGVKVKYSCFKGPGVVIDTTGCTGRDITPNQFPGGGTSI